MSQRITSSCKKVFNLQLWALDTRKLVKLMALSVSRCDMVSEKVLNNMLANAQSLHTELDDDFYSFYGCSDANGNNAIFETDDLNWTTPPDGNVVTLGSLPDEDECEDTEQLFDPYTGEDEDDDDKWNGTYCRCDDNDCNGSTAIAAPALAAVISVATLSRVF